MKLVENVCRRLIVRAIGAPVRIDPMRSRTRFLDTYGGDHSTLDAALHQGLLHDNVRPLLGPPSLNDARFVHTGGQRVLEVRL